VTPVQRGGSAASDRGGSDGWPLIGRQDLLEQVMAGLSEGRGVVLAGPAGIGKSRLAAEAARLLQGAGWTWLSAAASPSATSIPLGALAGLLVDEPPTDQGHIGLVTAMLRALGQAGGGQPVLLLVDDAHLLDDTSATVIHQAVIAGTVHVLATARDTDPVPPGVAVLWKDGLLQRIEVGPLDPGSVDDVVRAVLPGDVDGASLRRIWQATEGNPLFLRELVLGAQDTGLLEQQGGIWRLRGSPVASARLQELVLARVSDSSPAEQAALEVLAVGEPLGLDTLVSLVSADAVEALERRGLISVGSDDRRRPARLAHAVHGEVLRARMPAIARVRVARQLADAIEEHGARRRDDTMRVATWRLEGGGASQPDRLLEAARLAFAGRSHALAERLARAAVDTGGGTEAMVLHGTMLAELGRHQDADEVLQAIEATATTDAEHALAAIRRSVHLLWALGDEGAYEVLDRAAARVTDTAWSAEIAAQRANLFALAGRARDAIAAGGEFVGSEVDRVAVRAATGAAIAGTLAARFDDAIAAATDGWQRQQQLADQRGFGSPGFHVVTLTMALIEGGRFEEARSIAEGAYDFTIDAADRVGQAWVALALARLDHAAGRLATARSWATESAAAFGDTHQDTLRRAALGTLAMVAAQAGDQATAAETVGALDSQGAGPMAFLEPVVDQARAWTIAAGGDLPAARAATVEAAHRWSALGADAVVVSMAGDLVRFGAPAAAEECLRDMPGSRAWPTGGLIRDWAQARSGTELEAVARGFDQAGMPVLAGEAAAQAAAAFAADGNERHRHRLSTWSATLTAGTGAVTPALSLGGDAGRLTPREREVATLAAHGGSSRSIAEQLAVSERTVENHLQRAYVKLGISSRDELADALGTQPPEPRRT
jgi:DNA-binding CsgD family transcriptional regulator